MNSHQSFEVDKYIFEGLQKCMKLREKYMKLSCQRLGDNPKDSPSFVADPPKFNSLNERNNNNYSSRLSLNTFNNSPNVLRGIKSSDYSSSTSDLKHFIDEVDARTELRTEEGSLYQRSSINIGPTYQLFDYDLDACLIPDAANHAFKISEEGILRVYLSEKNIPLAPLYEIPTIKDFFQDLDIVMATVTDGPIKTFSFRRLKYFENLFNMYILLNEAKEIEEQKKVPHRDFYNVRKVDTHVHHSSSMNQKHLLRFIKSKLKKHPKDVVIFRDKKYLTLEQVFESLNLTAYDLSIDTLDMHAHKDSFHRFDMFNSKYNPIGETRLREIFLKTDNLIQGKYLSEISKEVISDMEASRYQMAEYRISIYGKSTNEWDKLAAWVCDNQLFSDNVRWIIQVPRLYSIYKENNVMDSFESIVINVFQPLFEVTKDPASHRKLHIFLQRVVGFDSVDDESKTERRIHKKYPYPKDWTSILNPPYAYYLYYLYANMTSLNQFRKDRGLNTFTLRPHSGEAGDSEHLAAAYLTSMSISHGITLRKVPALQYLYYLMQIGIALSPLSNNALFLNYDRNPFPYYFKIGMNVSLSTDDPLQFHYTKEPLIEEYSVAAHTWKLSSADMCEICRNSVSQSGFELSFKQHWLGTYCMEPGSKGNDIKKSNVPSIRSQFRHDTLERERAWILSSGTTFYQEPQLNSLSVVPFLPSIQISVEKETEEILDESVC